MRVLLHLFLLSLFGLVLVLNADAQTRNKKNEAKRPQSEKTTTTENKAETERKATESVPTQTTVPPQKRNERKSSSEGEQADAPSRTPETYNLTQYIYEFSQPAFYISKITIRHDETGKGTITFLRNDIDDEITDPLTISPGSVEHLNTLFQELDFLESSENYQYSKDYSHLGNVKITLKRGVKERTSAFNWTENKAAKSLAAEYRKISNQYVWAFDIKIARENQPLETPRIMDRLDGFLRRGEISDPPQLLPFLIELNNDERLPLMARNRASKIIDQIKKKAEKDKK